MNAAMVRHAPKGEKRKNVLVLLGSEAFLRIDGGSRHPVGAFFDEVSIPSLALIRSGFNLTMATPQGNKPPVDQRSNSSRYFGGNATLYNEALQFWASYPSLNNPLRLTQLAVEDPRLPVNATTPLLSQFDYLFIPGGHGPLIDLYSSTSAARIVIHFVDHQKPIGAICHGPLILTTTALLRQPWDFAGKNMTVLSTVEEKLSEEFVFNGTIGFYPQVVMQALGGNMVEGLPFSSNVVVDGLLITGQNPFSADAFARTIVQYWS